MIMARSQGANRIRIVGLEQVEGPTLVIVRAILAREDYEKHAERQDWVRDIGYPGLQGVEGPVEDFLGSAVAKAAE